MVLQKEPRGPSSSAPITVHTQGAHEQRVLRRGECRVSEHSAGSLALGLWSTMLLELVGTGKSE